jgi:hypothetical protein
LTVAALCGARLMAYGPIHMWARVGAARAERAGGRSVARSGAGYLESVEKLVTHGTAPVGSLSETGAGEAAGTLDGGTKPRFDGSSDGNDGTQTRTMPNLDDRTQRPPTSRLATCPILRIRRLQVRILPSAHR